MAHARRRVLDQIVAELMNLGETGSNVYEDPTSAIAESTVPAIVVEATGEDVEKAGEGAFDSGDGFQVRTLSVEVSAIAKSVSSRDQSAQEIEEALIDARIGHARNLIRTTFSSQADGSARLWVATLSFDFIFATRSNYPRAIIRTR